MISGAGAMNPVCPREDGHLEWGNGVVSMLFDTAGDSPVRLCNVAGRGMGPIGGRVTDDGRTVLERDPAQNAQLVQFDSMPTPRLISLRTKLERE